MRTKLVESIRVRPGEYFGEVYAVKCFGYTVYGYQVTVGEDNYSIAYDFGFDHVEDARNACEAEILKNALTVLNEVVEDD